MPTCFKRVVGAAAFFRRDWQPESEDHGQRAAFEVGERWHQSIAGMCSKAPGIIRSVLLLQRLYQVTQRAGDSLLVPVVGLVVLQHDQPF